MPQLFSSKFSTDTHIQQASISIKILVEIVEVDNIYQLDKHVQNAQMTGKFSPYKSDNLRPPFIQLAHIKREKAF